MKEKLKNTILLIIQDLKDLGLIGRKKKGGRKKRRVNNSGIKFKRNKKNPQTNSSNLDTENKRLQTFTNSSNLDTENKRLQNEVLSNEVSIRNSGLSNPTNMVQHKAIEDLQQSHNDFKRAAIEGFQYLHHKTRLITDEPQRTRFEYITPNIKIDENENNYDEDNNNYEYDGDSIDVPTNGGSDNFVAEGNKIPDGYNAPTSISWGSPIVQEPIIQEPRLKPNQPIIQPPFNLFDTLRKRIHPENNIIDDNHTVNSDLFSNTSLHSYNQNDKKSSISNSSISSISNSDISSISADDDFQPAIRVPKTTLDVLYDQADAVGLNRNEFTANKTALRTKIRNQDRINALIEEYHNLGGDDDKIANSNSVRVLNAGITVRKLQEQYNSLNGPDQKVYESNNPAYIRKAIKDTNDNLKKNLDSLIKSQPNKINSYFK